MMDINQLALMFVATAVLIQRYLVICKVGLIDSIWAHILPLLAYPVALFLVKQFVEQVPDSLIEAAYIDGATDWTVYQKNHYSDDKTGYCNSSNPCFPAGMGKHGNIKLLCK